jgi:regulatory protein
LAAKLEKREYSAAEIAGTLERLTNAGLLNDPELARQRIRGRLAREPIGRRRLEQDLRRRGVDGQLARETLEELYPEDEGDLVRWAADRWHGRGDGRALARHLERKGFSSRAIFALLRQREAEESLTEPS